MSENMSLPEKNENETKYHKIQRESDEDNKIDLSARVPIKIDPKNNRYPFCLVWSPITIFSYIIPIIGHAGICNSQGIIHEFGPEFVEIEKLPFGKPTKYVPLELKESEIEKYNKAFENAVNMYNHIKFNFIRYNCHSFPASVLTLMNYKGKKNYNVVDIWWMFLTKSVYNSKYDIFRTYRGFLCFLLIIFTIYYFFLNKKKFIFIKI